MPNLLPQSLVPLKNSLKITGLDVVEYSDQKVSGCNYIGFKDKEGIHIRIGIYLHEGCNYICTWGIQNHSRRAATMSRWINKVNGICSDWEIGWESAGKGPGGYPSKVKCIDDMEIYEIIGELYKFM